MKQTLIFLITFCITFHTIAQTSKPSRPMAKTGDSVWIILTHVKADKRQQFETFINNVFWPAAKKLKPEDQKVFVQTRVLYATKPEADGSYAYFFIMDPLIPGGDYDIESLLTKEYGAQKGSEYYEQFEETLAAPQVEYKVLQSKY